MDGDNARLPAGTLSFLFTDIEGSTARWEADQAAMSADLAAHDRMLRRAIAERNGYIFKTVGDAFCAAFSVVSDAIDAAIEAQRELAAAAWIGKPIHVRMGIHVGTAELREGDYFGPTLNRVSRLCALGHGGQILLSEAARVLAKDKLPAGTSLADLGSRRLKDVPGCERIWQLRAEGLRADFPYLPSLDGDKAHVPAELTTFVGRQKEIMEVEDLVCAARLVTLTGVGGTGKTRLAMRAARDLADQFEEGSWFVDLAPLTSAEDVPKAVSAALHIRESGASRLADEVIAALGGKEILVLLDNCEHLIDAAAAFASAVLASCPKARILATSREALGIGGETVYRVPPLGSPEPSRAADGAFAGTPAESMRQYEAVKLFIERARAAKSDFAIDEANAPWVAEICYRLDGIPLAIELAAARIRAFGCADIAARLADRFALLRSGGRDVLPRQKTLQALIDWSWDLLPREDRECLAALSVLRGSFDALAAEDVAGAGAAESVADLVEKSLVVQVEEGGRARYRLLETIRDYAAQRLRESGKEAQVHEAFISRYERLCRGASERIFERGGLDLIAALVAERADILEAISLCAQSGDRRAVAIAGETFSALHFVCDFEAARRLIVPLIGPPPPEGADPPDSILALLGIARTAVMTLSFSEAQAAAERALRAARAAGDARQEARSLSLLGSLARGGATSWAYGGLNNQRCNFAEAAALYREAEEVSRRGSYPLGILEARAGLGVVAQLTQDLETAGPLLRECREAAASAGNAIVAAWMGLMECSYLSRRGQHEAALRAALGEYERFSGTILPQIPYQITSHIGGHLVALDRAKEAVPWYEKCLAIAEAERSPWMRFNATMNLCTALGDAGRSEEIEARLSPFLSEGARNLPWRDDSILMEFLVVFSFVIEARGDAVFAAEALGAGAVYETSPFTGASDLAATKRLRSRLRAALGAEELTAAESRGRSRSPRDAMRELAALFPACAALISGA